MSNTTLFENGDHKNILLEDFSDPGAPAVQCNQHLIIHGNEAMILDPGGHKLYTPVLSETNSCLSGGKSLKHIFLSHQDPDIVAAVNGWLMTTDATAWVSALWTRFVAHFGVDKLVLDRLEPIPDEGMWLELDGYQLAVVPAHFMHSPGNFQIYDPESKILYTGDLGASLGQDYVTTEDFDSHLQFLSGFHQRYVPCNAVLKVWVRMVRELDVEILAPQHGAMMQGECVDKFLSWLENLQCGVDVMQKTYALPPREPIAAG
jgi:flavorubredoxin